MVETLTSRQLRRCYDASELRFSTTADVPDIVEPVGQPRAVAAIELAANMAAAGLNIFAFGTPGTARRALLVQILGDRAKERPGPPDLCYVYNFAEPYKPRVLVVPRGRGTELRRDMDSLVEELRAALGAAFESDEYRKRREAIENEVKARPERRLHELSDRAEREGLSLLHTPMGFAFAAVRNGEPLSEEAFEKLSEDERERLHKCLHAFQQELAELLRQLPTWERERRNRTRELDRDIVKHAVGHLVEEVRKAYAALPNVNAHLKAVEADLIEHARALLEDRNNDISEGPGETLRPSEGRGGALRRYAVNLLVDNSALKGAPVIVEDNPTCENLIGRVDFTARLGTLVTDFTLIRAGALHRANGGYLILDALRVLRAPFAWDALKLALQSRRLRIEPLSRLLGFGSTIALEPEAADLDVRVALVGEPWVYYLLNEHDADFRELFKVAADFAEDLDAVPEPRGRYVQMLATLARREGYLPFDAAAVARVLEESARLAGAQDRLSLRVDCMSDVMREADYWARSEAAEHVGAQHVDRAVAARLFRLDRLRERVLDETQKGAIMIDTSGARVGQINGLSIVPLGEFMFGRPSRITARVRVGQGKVMDIEREVELGGPIHSKGVLILDAFLAGRYALKSPLSLHASLVFEQSYSSVEGDSASAAELCALLSAIASVPLTQRIAVTGSVNQHGAIQPVGGINEKIEGFFDLCKARGLTGEQGVVMPRANVRHLMLRRDVVEAVAAGQFHIFAVETIDEALELLTGLAAGERNEAGFFPAGSVNQLVELQLEEFARQRREFDSPLPSPALSAAAPTALNEQRT